MWRPIFLIATVIGLAGACSGGSEDNFVDLMQKTREGTFTVMYDLEFPGEVAESITWYRMGEYQRTDSKWISPGSDEEHLLTVLSGPDGAYHCSEVPLSITQMLVGCVRGSAAAIFVDGPPVWLHTAIQRPEALDVKPLEGKTLVDADAQCFAVSADSGEGGDLDVCLSDGGVPLYIEMSVAAVEGSLVYTATSFSESVPEGIFKPPMEVVGEGSLCPDLC